MSDLELGLRYSTGQNDLTDEFFVPCLNESVRYDRAVGYFSSTFYALIRLPLAEFVERGGRIRVVCSPQLSSDDISAIEDGYVDRAAGRSIDRDLDQLTSDRVGKAAARLLGALIAYGAIELKLAFNRNERGIFHDKVGIFVDQEGERVSFTGSANETWSAWSGTMNHESFHVFTSWTEEGSKHVDEDVASFERLWADSDASVEVVDFPSVSRNRLVELSDNEGIREAQKQLDVELQSGRLRPTLRRHQKNAISGWEKGGHRGIFEHATGSGKTITALSCIDLAVKADLPILVLVPSRALLHQWKSEIAGYFANASVLLAGDGYNAWKAGSVLRDSLTDVVAGRPSIVLATMDTASSETFSSRIDDIQDLFVVADEVHRIGTPRRRRILQITANWRLGLSATWRREGDEVGTKAIAEFFGSVIEPPYTLADAIRDGHLCPYRYFVHEVELEEGERQEWSDFTARIGQAMARSSGELTENVKHLLIQRSRIVKSAAGKVALAAGVVAEQYQDGEAWLVYCDDSVQLAAVRQALASRGVNTLEFHTNSEGAVDVDLGEFSRSGGVMLSINCLDEGVDIPRISHALILASSTTHRQYVQRRGRVLRQHSSKFRAEIHDALVVSAESEDPNSASYMRRELARALEFVQSASDSTATEVKLQLLAAQIGDGTIGQFDGDGSDDEAEENAQ